MATRSEVLSPKKLGVSKHHRVSEARNDSRTPERVQTGWRRLAGAGAVPDATSGSACRVADAEQRTHPCERPKNNLIVGIGPLTPTLSLAYRGEGGAAALSPAYPGERGIAPRSPEYRDDGVAVLVGGGHRSSSIRVILVDPQA